MKQTMNAGKTTFFKLILSNKIPISDSPMVFIAPERPVKHIQQYGMNLMAHDNFLCWLCNSFFSSNLIACTKNYRGSFCIHYLVDLISLKYNK